MTASTHRSQTQPAARPESSALRAVAHQYVPVLLIAALWVGAVARYGWSPYMLACAAVAAPAVWAAWTDLHTRTLPLKLTLSALAAAVIGVLVAGVHAPGAAAHAMLAGLATFAALSVIGGLLRPYAFGDVLLATPLAMLAGYHDWASVAGLAVLTSVVSVPVAVAVMIRDRTLRAVLPLGPSLLVAAVIVIGIG